MSNFFNSEALTTTIPAQLVKKFNIPIIPIYIERIKDLDFKITIKKPINFTKETTVQKITDDLNRILEKMILKNLNNGYGRIIVGNKIYFFLYFLFFHMLLYKKNMALVVQHSNK